MRFRDAIGRFLKQFGLGNACQGDRGKQAVDDQIDSPFLGQRGRKNVRNRWDMFRGIMEDAERAKFRCKI